LSYVLFFLKFVISKYRNQNHVELNSDDLKEHLKNKKILRAREKKTLGAKKVCRPSVNGKV